MLVYKGEQVYEARFIEYEQSHTNLEHGTENWYAFRYAIKPSNQQIEIRLSQMGMDLMREFGHDPHSASNEAANKLLLHKFSTSGSDPVLSITPADVISVLGGANRRG